MAHKMFTRALNSIRIRLKNTRDSKQAAFAHRAAFDQNPEKLFKINDVINRYHLSDGLKHPFQAYKLLELERLLHHYRPNNIVEFGTGSSSRIFMEYLQQNKFAKLTCVDEQKSWLDGIADDAAFGEISDRVTLHHTDREIQENNVVEFRYRTNPNIKADFVFVDGPSHLLAGHNLKNVVDSNALHFVTDTIRPVIIVSARRATVEFFNKNITGYRLIKSDLLMRKFKKNYNYFSIFEPLSEQETHTRR